MSDDNKDFELSNDDELKPPSKVHVTSREPFKADPLTSGNYTCSLKIKNCEQDIWEKSGKKVDGSDAWSKTGKTKPAYRFVFKVEGQRSWICHTVPATTSNEGNLWKTIRLLNRPGGIDLSSITFNDKGWAENGDEFFAALKGLLGWKYKVSCEVNPNPKNPDNPFIKYLAGMNTGEVDEGTIEGHELTHSKPWETDNDDDYFEIPF